MQAASSTLVSQDMAVAQFQVVSRTEAPATMGVSSNSKDDEPTSLLNPRAFRAAGYPAIRNALVKWDKTDRVYTLENIFAVGGDGPSPEQLQAGITRLVNSGACAEGDESGGMLIQAADRVVTSFFGVSWASEYRRRQGQVHAERQGQVAEREHPCEARARLGVAERCGIGRPEPLGVVRASPGTRLGAQAATGAHSQGDVGVATR